MCIHAGEKGDDQLCAVILVNEGVKVVGTSVSLFFRGSEAVNSYLCRLRSVDTDTGYTSCEKWEKHDIIIYALIPRPIASPEVQGCWTSSV